MTSAAATPPVSPANGLRVLVVDDNRDSAESIAILLRFLGHSVETAYNGLEAVRHALEFDPELVLLDLDLPGIDGFEVARRIRRQHRGANIMIAAVTGWGRSEDIRKASEAGFDRHYVKPLKLEALRGLLELPERRPAHH